MRGALLLVACGFQTVGSPADLAGAPCTLAPYGGCGGGEKCVYFAGGTRCAPDGTVPIGGRCTTSRDNDTCQGAATCDFVSAAGVGVCTPWCLSDGNCTSLSLSAANPSRCRFVAGAPPRCSIPCDPLAAQNGCATPEFGCYLTSTGGGSSPAVTDCIPAGMAVPVGGHCDNIQDCVAGAMCITNTSGFCRQICNLVMPAQCAAGESCVSTGSINDSYGVCCPPGC